MLEAVLREAARPNQTARGGYPYWNRALFSKAEATDRPGFWNGTLLRGGRNGQAGILEPNTAESALLSAGPAERRATRVSEELKTR
jgi:hypothetical protein